jgi:hypothetical protein
VVIEMSPLQFGRESEELPRESMTSMDSFYHPPDPATIKNKNLIRSVKAMATLLGPTWTCLLALVPAHVTTSDQFYDETPLAAICSFWASIALCMWVGQVLARSLLHVWTQELLASELRQFAILVRFAHDDVKFFRGKTDTVILLYSFVSVIWLLKAGETCVQANPP